MTLLASIDDVPPEVRQRFSRIARRVSRNGTGFVHLERDSLGLVCVQHPAVVRCRDCARAHIDGHTRREEHGCDLCGDDFGATNRAHLDAHLLNEADTTVAIGRGRRAAVGIIWLYGWGACSRCVPIIDPAAN